MPKFTVLIIEDEKNIQTFVGKILKKQDYRVLYADCGKEGLNPQCPGKRLAGAGRQTVLLYLCPDHERQDAVWTGGRSLRARLHERGDQEA